MMLQQEGRLTELGHFSSFVNPDLVWLEIVSLTLLKTISNLSPQ